MASGGVQLTAATNGPFVYGLGADASDICRDADLRLAAKPSQADVAVAVGPPLSDVYAELAKAGRLLMPVLDLSGDGSSLPRTDFEGAGPNASELSRGIEVVTPILKRWQELPDIESSPDRRSLLALAFAYTRDTGLYASWDFTAPGAVSYHLLAGLHDQRQLLEELASAELLAREHFDRVHVCPGCNGSRLNVREECPACRGSHLADGELIHHYHCAHQARESAFVQGNRLLCPKCRRELRHYGVDYDKPDIVTLCRSCGTESDEPVVGFVCMDCAQHTDADRIDVRSWWHYQLTPQGVTTVQRGLLPHVSLVDSLWAHHGGYALRDFAILARSHHAVAERYNRPLSLLTVRLTNLGLLGKEKGQNHTSRLLALVIEAVSQSLRQSDAVTARDNALYILLTETELRDARGVAERIHERVESTTYSNLELTLTTHTADEIKSFIKELTA